MEQSFVDYKKAIADLGNDKDLYKDLLDCWFSEIQLQKTVLDDFRAKNAFADAASYIHRIKGAAGSLGALELFRAAQKVEDILRAKSADDLNLCLSTLFTVYEKTNAEFKELQKNL
ncbi:Hpt domain-containing protein [Treponema sp. OMZ 840]|uniref:Hpt domain-containing protein n=1 Tax=Treponema sp. OMZ 840 TaxID=244313 RepID=UPI003D93A4EA